MKIITATSTCSKSVYEQIFHERKQRILDPSQKFFEQLISGMAGCESELESIIAISAKPVSASTTRKRFFPREVEVVNNRLQYRYVRFINGKVLRFITVWLSVFFEVCRAIDQNAKKDTVVITDPLYCHISNAARIAARLKGVKCIAILTDIPTLSTGMKQYKQSSVRQTLQDMYESLSDREATKYDAYIILTEAMNDVVNPKHRPHCVIEGSVDASTGFIEKVLQKESGTIAVYAGGIHEKYGVMKLARAFVQANIPNAELHVYGDGSCLNELKQFAEQHHSVKYQGCALTTEMVEIESKADLLINPRYTEEEYTKYSFPSKTLEYLSSGTAVLSTRLPGIPREYDEYMYWFWDESFDSMTKTLAEVLLKTKAELYSFGMNGKRFVLAQKNNIYQGQRIIEFCELIIEK